MRRLALLTMTVALLMTVAAPAMAGGGPRDLSRELPVTVVDESRLSPRQSPD